MIAPSRRYVLPAILLLLLASVPGTLSARHPRLRDPCQDPAELRELEAIPGTVDEGERLARLSRERIQWSEGSILDERGKATPLRFHVVRDYDSHGFYVRPFQVAVGNLEPERQESHSVDTAVGPMRIHRAVDGARLFTHGAPTVASWTFLYENEPIDSPLRAKLRHAWTELREGRRPVTLLVVYGPVPPQSNDRLLARSDAWMKAAVEHHVMACGSS